MTANALLLAATLLLRYPDLHGDRIVFSYAGDLWTTSVSGGDAQRLTSHDGYEYLPKWSPDGTLIAFSAEYDGTTDVHVIPAGGGMPRRLTWHPWADRVTGWTRDGHIVFRSKRASVIPAYDKLFTIATTGGAPRELTAVPSSGTNSFSPDGTQIAYTPVATETTFWKRYRGGTQSHITLLDLKTLQSLEIPHGDAAELFPMWFGEAVYFVSDRDGVMNLYRYDVRSRDIRKLTDHAEYDVKWPSLSADGSGRIIYEHGGALHLYDIARGNTTRLDVRVPTDAPVLRPTVINAQKWLHTANISPSGARAVVAARGEIFTVPAKDGEIRNLTNTSGVRELWPVWSPDGRSIAYASDRSGEYELYVRPQDGSGEERRITTLGPGFRSQLTWSPDSKKIAYSELSLALMIADVATGEVTEIDRAEVEPITGFDWSPDGRWIAYAKTATTGFGQLFIYSLAEKRTRDVTTRLTDDRLPRFSRDGKYLFFFSRRTFRPRWSDVDRTFNFNDTTGIYAMSLRKDTPSPFAPKSDEEPILSDGLSARRADSDGRRAESPSLQIGFDGISERVVPLPIEAGDYGALAVTEAKLFYLAKKALKSFDLGSREEKTVIDGINSYALDAQGKKVLYRADQKLGIVDASATSKVGDGALDLTNLTMRLDRQAEWRQIFNEAWRMMRDNFYDPTMRGVDWPAMKRRYEAELPHVATRSDLNFLIGEMNAELEVSHISASGGDSGDARRTNVGLLGADYDVAGGRYRIRKIYRGDNSADDSRSPLTAPAVDVREGDYILAVNGRPLLATESIHAALDNTAGRQVTLRVNATPKLEGARTVVVVPLATEERVRYLDFVETNRRKVSAATEGRCAYVHLPSTNDDGISAFARQFYAQADKQCLLLDARWNSGGHIPDFFFERLARRHVEYDAPRYGVDVEYQQPAIFGPKVLVINEYAGSGGDSVADYFRKFALGPIVGKRTWGGLMGIGGELPMIDNGRVTVPFVSAWDVVDGKSEWIVENRGVAPDIEVDQRPDLLAQGRDPQLERGIEILKEQLAKQPQARPKRPPYGR
ncbi:MAG TPA: PDZ domain-containing protein [Thermoanaerobaculia bacterium]|nr:PDZ domain-containing protein [Thermoanaerobaculia bacterium]